MKSLTCLFGLLSCLLATALHADEQSQEKHFRGQIAPILVGHCLDCHGAERKGGLDLRSKATMLAGGDSGSVIEPGSPDDSLLHDYVAAGEMPPKRPLSAEQIASLKKWIADGAWFPDQPLDPFGMTTDTRAGFDWWSLQPLANEAPAAPDAPADWQASPIDRFVYANLKASGLEPSPSATPRVLIRRATYDLHGLPPTPAEIDRFVKACEQEAGGPNRIGPQAYEALIDRLLASGHYGEQWGRHWLDVVRFGESNGFERNVIHNTVWPFRDYVIRSLNSDKPFDRFITEHLAGDALAPNDPSVAVGTAFLVCGAYDNVGNQDPVAAAQIRANTIDEIIRATTDSFLGLTVGCSRCHDHKFDPIAQRDYYSLYATFAGVRHGERTIESKPTPDQQAAIETLQATLAKVQRELSQFEPIATPGKTIVIDDETPTTPASGDPEVTLLTTKLGHGNNPPGNARGHRQDTGGVDRSPNLSRGRYLYWTNTPGTEVFTYAPNASGSFRVWLSWGCGWPTHTPNARYVLDRDGDLTTTDDQQVIATVDQRYFAGGGPEPSPKLALWSGFHFAGVHEFTPASRVVLRCGDTGEAITTDVIVLQSEPPQAATSTQPRLRAKVNARQNIERIAPTKAKYLRFTIHATNASEPCLDELEVYRADETSAVNVAASSNGGSATSSGNYMGNPKHQLEHINDGKFGNSQSWISNESGGGWVQIEFAKLEEIDRIVWGRDRELQFSDRLATSYEIAVATEPDQWRVVASSTDRLPLDTPFTDSDLGPIFGLTADDAAKAEPLIDQWNVLRAELERHRDHAESHKWWVGNYQQQNGPFHTFIGGSPQRKGTEVQPASMKTLARVTKEYNLPSNSSEQLRRLQLAMWITAADNPLTPRVLANRLWHYHFGTGIVSTPSDFGFMGGRPSHRALLDWLAFRLKEHDWRLKPLHKEIMLSQTYRQSSDYRADAAKIDGNSRLLWRFPPRRLAAEEIRDATLAIAGRLDSTMYGPGFRLFNYVQDNVATYHPLDVHGPETYRRGVYHHRARAMQIDLLSEFDSPDCAFSAPRRSVTTTPLQALTLMNHQFTLDMSAALAERLRSEAGEDIDAQVERAFQLAFGRSPEAEETMAATELIEAHGLRAFCRAMLNANELIYLQ